MFVPPTGVLEIDPAIRGVQRTVAGSPGRKHAIKHIHSTGNTIPQIFRTPHTHEVSWFVARQVGCAGLQHCCHHRLGFAHAQATNGAAGNIVIAQLVRRLLS